MAVIKSAGRVVTGLAVFKWVSIAVVLIGTAVTDLLIGAASDWPDWTLQLQWPVTVAGLLTAAGIWLAVGWLQSMLALNVNRESREEIQGITMTNQRV